MSGSLTDLRVSEDGRAMTVLKDAKKPKGEGIPPSVQMGSLWRAFPSGQTPVQIADGVVNLPGGWQFSPDSHWVFAVAQWSPRTHQGTLVAADVSAPDLPPRTLASDVSFFTVSADSMRIAFVADGVLREGPLPEGPYSQLGVEVSTAQFAKDTKSIVFHQKIAAGGALYAAILNGKGRPRRLLELVADYTLLGSGDRIVATHLRKIGEGVLRLSLLEVASGKTSLITNDGYRYLVGPGDEMIAWRTQTSSGKTPLADVGDLWLARLQANTTPRKLATNAKDFEFSADGKRFAYRANWKELQLGAGRPGLDDSKIEPVGDLSLLELPDGPPKLLQKNCPNFLFSQDGAALAFTARIESPIVTRRLKLLSPGEAEAVDLKDWLYEYQFQPPGTALFFRANCTREGRSCDLLAVDVAKPKEPARTAARAVYGVRFSKDGTRAVYVSAHLTDQQFDLYGMRLNPPSRQQLDPFATWPALLLGPAGSQVAYLVQEVEPPGLYVAAVP